MDKFDLVIIGGGPAGLAAAARACGLGAKTALVESAAPGGAGVNTGALWGKNLLRVGEVVHTVRQKNLRALKGTQNVGLSFAEALREAAEVVAAVRRRQYPSSPDKLKSLNRIQGRAVFSGANRIEVGGRELQGRKFIIATGSAPRIPRIAGLDEAGFITDTEVLKLKEAPASLVIVGGGPLGLEFAQMFSHFGTRVRVIQHGPRILPRLEPEIAEAASAYLEDDGIIIHTDQSVLAVHRQGDAKLIKVKTVGLDQTYRAQEVMVAVGRIPSTAGLGLKRVGVELDAGGAIVVNDEFRTTAPDIYAAGDAVGEPMLKSVAMMEGRMAAANALGGERLQIDYDAVPSCTFTHPEVAQVGLTEAEAARRGHQASARLLDFEVVTRAQIMRDARGLIKMVAETVTGRILGCGVVAAQAGEIINEAALAVKQRVTARELAETPHAYPTTSEALVLAADEFSQMPGKSSAAKQRRPAA